MGEEMETRIKKNKDVKEGEGEILEVTGDGIWGGEGYGGSKITARTVE